MEDHFNTTPGANAKEETPHVHINVMPEDETPTLGKKKKHSFRHKLSCSDNKVGIIIAHCVGAAAVILVIIAAIVTIIAASKMSAAAQSQIELNNYIRENVDTIMEQQANQQANPYYYDYSGNFWDEIFGGNDATTNDSSDANDIASDESTSSNTEDSGSTQENNDDSSISQQDIIDFFQNIFSGLQDSDSGTSY